MKLEHLFKYSLYILIASLISCGGGSGTTPDSNEGTEENTVTLPSAPSELKAGKGINGISVSWKDNSDNEDSFIIKRSKNDSSFVVIATLEHDTETYNDSNLNLGSIYGYRVKAINKAGETEYSNIAVVNYSDETEEGEGEIEEGEGEIEEGEGEIEEGEGEIEEGEGEIEEGEGEIEEGEGEIEEGEGEIEEGEGEIEEGEGEIEEGEGEIETPVISNFAIDKTDNITEGDQLTISANISDNKQVQSAYVYINSERKSAMSKADGISYSYKLNTDGTFGIININIKAFDNDGNSTESEIITVNIKEKNWVSPAKVDFKKVDNFGSNPGDLKMFLYVPEGLSRNSPVVIAMHGCNQNGKALVGAPNDEALHDGHADAFNQDTEWSVLADKYKFIVIFPEQTVRVTSASDPEKVNNDYACFNWAGYYGLEIGRDKGESKSIISMLDYVKENYSVDDNGIFATGLSAGGGMTNALLVHYPDVFNAGGTMSGVTYGCAHVGPTPGTTDITLRAMDCMGVSRSSMLIFDGMPEELKKTPDQWAQIAKDYGPENYKGQYPRIIVWQGNSDEFVDYAHLNETMEQFTTLHDTDQTADNATKILKTGNNQHIFEEYQDQYGSAVVATVTLKGMTHGITVDPTNIGEDGGGKCHSGVSKTNDNCGVVMMGATWAHDMGIYSSYYTAKWWGLLDRTYPKRDDNYDKVDVEITSLTNYDIVAKDVDSVKVIVDAFHEQGISHVELYIDDKLTLTDDSTPFSFNWTPSGLMAGDLVTVTVKAYSKNDQTTATDSVDVWYKEKTKACVTAKNTEHIDAGRATECMVYSNRHACALGSGTDLGLALEYWSETSSIIEETPGNWVEVTSCP